VLLVVLAASVFAVTVLSSLAKVSLRRVVEARDAELALRQRWGALSLERALLSEAPTIFEQREKIWEESNPGQPPPPPRIRDAITISGVTFDVMIGDEDAKLNLNSLYHRAGMAEVNQALAEVLPPAGRLALALWPAVEPMQLRRQQVGRPAPESNDEEKRPQVPMAFRSWGEVFDLTQLSAALQSDAALPNATIHITCWGNGPLNIRRASDQTVLAVLGSVIQDGGAQRLLQAYRGSPAPDIELLLVSQVRSERQRSQLRRQLSEISTNFSLWIDASTKSGRRLRRFVVMQRDEEGTTRYEKFAH
jgi:hypothetical protein